MPAPEPEPEAAGMLRGMKSPVHFYFDFSSPYSYIANADAAAIETLYQAYQQNPESVDFGWRKFFEGFDFSQQFTFPWDRMYVFAPYSSRDTVNSALGFEWAGYDQSVIENTDTVNLVVFVKDSKVVGWFEQARSVDLDQIATPDGYARSDASFRVKPSELGVVLQR